MPDVKRFLSRAFGAVALWPNGRQWPCPAAVTTIQASSAAAAALSSPFFPSRLCCLDIDGRSRRIC